ncbi:mucin-5AC-like, partial [Xenopus laevis]|uniref:Mucin-5AC-like n=1 Tax=Xenopus laevis TaxID=8355 RepID=A0A8J1KKK7_XENLA
MEGAGEATPEMNGQWEEERKQRGTEGGRDSGTCKLLIISEKKLATVYSIDSYCNSAHFAGCTTPSSRLITSPGVDTSPGAGLTSSSSAGLINSPGVGITNSLGVGLDTSPKDPSYTYPDTSPWCTLTPWIDVSYPEFGETGGDNETFDNIRSLGISICNNTMTIAGVDCRATDFPSYSLAEVGQTLTCNKDIGLICLNSENFPKCNNYEIQIQCCSSTKPIDIATETPTETSEIPIKTKLTPIETTETFLETTETSIETTTCSMTTTTTTSSPTTTSTTTHPTTTTTSLPTTTTT